MSERMECPRDDRASVAALPHDETFCASGACLSYFQNCYAEVVASWVRSESELAWLAPGTPWPLTAEKVLVWGQERRERFLLWNGRDEFPIGYAELNEMPKTRDQLWIGHFMLDPVHRGCGWAVRFAQALLARAFVERQATDVLLVVVPDNERAIRCYQRAGMIDQGQERKHFKTTRRDYLFNRMAISRGRFRKLAGLGQLPDTPLPIRGRPAAEAPSQAAV
ncbi:hypothetical protein B7486_00325 [cyanobacterium TDX16]|nr:hypothetical protein B7486_00325 [cyanobacterium TDX16]